ncbi:MAG: FkbM family methyltransferase [Elusimicrobia bacterium]|nr:FkbM family methyltransferase [Elusimicrobiota bacterium]
MKALRNFLRDVSAQFRRPGGLLPRLACVLRFWAGYEWARLKGKSQGDSRLAAMAGLAGRGLNASTVTTRTAGGLSIELDVFSAVYLLQEIIDEGTYRAPGFVPEAGWTVVDVGAHQGIFTLDCARRVGPAGRVLAVEPFPFNRALLERNVKANGLAWVSVSPFAAAEARETKTFYVTPYSTGWQSLVFTGDARVPTQVEAERLDAVLAAQGVDRVDLLKVDVEGAWRLVFAGAPALLARRPRIVMEVEGDEAEVAAATARLRELGYGVERRDSVLFGTPNAA